VREAQQHARTAKKLDHARDILLLVFREPVPPVSKLVRVDYFHARNIGLEVYGVKSIIVLGTREVWTN